MLSLLNHTSQGTDTSNMQPYLRTIDVSAYNWLAELNCLATKSCCLAVISLNTFAESIWFFRIFLNSYFKIENTIM